MYVFTYHIVFLMKNESTMAKIKTDSEIVLLFYIEMHDPTIFLILPDHMV